MLRTTLLAAARSPVVRRMVEGNPLSRSVVDRFVAGTEPQDALRTCERLHERGMTVTLDYLGEDIREAEQAAATAGAYQRVLSLLGSRGLAPHVEVSIKLSAMGLLLAHDGRKVALENARRICESAQAVGTTVTLDMEDHTTTDVTLAVLGDLRVDFPWVGAVLQAYLHRTEQDCRDLATAGSRVRLCKGAYSEPSSVAFQQKHDVDRSYVRCLKVLMTGSGYPMVATHDPRMIRIASELAARAGRGPEDFEFQMLYGVRPDEQRRIAANGQRLRVYLPYGDQWYGYFMRRLAERPANVGFFLRALATRG